jgi:hypothetical protein
MRWHQHQAIPTATHQMKQPEYQAISDIESLLTSKMDPMYQKILQSLRLATFANQEQFPSAYLDKLAQKLRADFQHELDAWKALMINEGMVNLSDTKALDLHPPFKK